MVGFILACTGHRNRAVAGSNPALPTTFAFKNASNRFSKNGFVLNLQELEVPFLVLVSFALV